MKQLRGSNFAALSIIAVLSLLISFQNCSKIQMNDIDAELRAQEAEIARIGADSDVVTAGLSEVPDLKMVFVVDNSGTMKQNQFNLSQSFGTMFDSSSSSLGRFNSSTFLINTAQTLPIYQSDSERSSLFDGIANLQSGFTSGAAVSLDQLNLLRTADQNSGGLPGDNLGFSIKKSDSPLNYEILPAPVLGAQNNSGTISFSNQINLKAGADVAAVESEFKSRLSVMNADRFPMQKVSIAGVTQILPQYNQIVDSESGLCSVARILRNPASFFQPGQLVSFTVVSDENDNDPAGTKCVQSVKELVGTEKLIDLDCKKNQSTITYKPPTTIDTPEKCKLNGKSGYSFEFSYPNPDKVSTAIEYYAQTANDKYTAYYYNLKYKVFDKRTYTYKYTKVVYYLEECFDVYSDGNKIGMKCTPKTSPEPAQYYQGGVATTCWDLAKTFNPKALDVEGAKPTCTDEVKAIAVCNETDPRCTGADTYKDFLANNGSPIPGKVPGTQTDCDNEAKKDVNYVSGAVCTAANKTNLADCTGQATGSMCAVTTPKTYGYIAKTVSGNQAGSDNCVSYVKATYTNYAEAQATTDGKAFIKTCNVTTAAQPDTKVSGSMAFVDGAGNAYDGGTQLNLGDACSLSSGVLDKAYSIAVTKDAKVQKTNPCKITAINSAPESVVNKTLNSCDDHSVKFCADNKYRNCTAMFIGATSTPSNGPETLFKSLPERIGCDSKCGDSVLKLCDEGTDPAMLVKDFLISKYGARTICLSSTAVVETGKVSLTAQLEAQKDMLCKPSVTDGSPTYPYVTKSTYYSKEKIIDYVAGTAKSETGVYSPKSDLISYIKARVAELSTNQFFFTAFIQRSSDAPLAVGSKGQEYERLISDRAGQLESVSSNDYSVALKELSRVLKNSLERTLIVKKMRPDQIINQVSFIKKGSSDPIVLNRSSWSNVGNTLKISESFEFSEGDQFKVDFQNNVE